MSLWICCPWKKFLAPLLLHSGEEERKGGGSWREKVERSRKVKEGEKRLTHAEFEPGCRLAKASPVIH